MVGYLLVQEVRRAGGPTYFLVQEGRWIPMLLDPKSLPQM